MLVSYEEKNQRNTEESLPRCKNKDQRGTQARGAGDMQIRLNISDGDQWRKASDSQHGRLQNCFVQKWCSLSDNWQIQSIISQETLVSQTLFRYKSLSSFFHYYFISETTHSFERGNCIIQQNCYTALACFSLII